MKDVLRLELLLPGPPPDDVLPLLENDVRRDGGPDSPSVAATLLGENERTPNVPGLVDMFPFRLPFRSRPGISMRALLNTNSVARVRVHTSFDRVGFGVVSYVRGLGLRDLHLAVFLRLREGEILLIPLQTASRISDRLSSEHAQSTHCCCPPLCTGGAFLRMPLGLEFDRDMDGWCGRPGCS